MIESSRRYIEQYGFYEGGDTNEYRIDPVLLVAFLRGRADHTAVTVAQRRGLAGIRRLEQEVASLVAQKSTVKDADKLALESAIGRANAELQQQRVGLDNALARMRQSMQI